MQLEIDDNSSPPREELPAVALDLHLAGRMLSSLAAADAGPGMITQTLGLLAEQLERASLRLQRVTAALERKAPKIVAPPPARPNKKPARVAAPAKPPRANGTANTPPAGAAEAPKPAP